MLLFMLSTFETTMEQVNFGYSTKNIPAPTQTDYLKCLLAKTEKFMRSIRWRTFFFLNPEKTPDNKETYGFPSTKSPSPILELKEFEDDMLNLVQNIQFKHPRKQFQKKLRNDSIKIKENQKVLIPADKTTNFYKLKPEQYNKLLEENINKSYKKTTKSTVNNIIKTDQRIANNLALDDRIDTTAQNQAFISLKDHKPNFSNKIHRKQHNQD